MQDKTIKASPTKEFFVNMLVRDILLKQAIIELIDNSIDGAKNIISDNNFSGIKIELKYNKDNFYIEDNCGGIPIDIAENYAFRFGRSKDRASSETETTGIFGIGMKRALFKIGQKFSIESTTKNSKFKIDLDVLEWLENDTDWDFKFSNYEENLNNNIKDTGTTITITNLRKEVSDEFSDPDFEKEIIDHVQRRVGLDISYGINIIINGKSLSGNNIDFINDSNVKPIKIEYADDNVDVKIYAGLAKKVGPKYTPENAGWYIYCNGRLVVAADKSSLTTWKDLENKRSGVTFHNDYAGFRGAVFFNSKFPEKLPWNTTKTGIDETSYIFLRARERMLDAFKIVKNFIDDMKNYTKNTDDGIEETVSNMKSIELNASNAYNVLQPNKELSINNIKVVTPPNVTISYKKPKSEVERIKEISGVSSNKEVGELTFEYYMDAEG